VDLGHDALQLCERHYCYDHQYDYQYFLDHTNFFDSLVSVQCVVDELVSVGEWSDID
jgi:hypothetical protein